MSILLNPLLDSMSILATIGMLDRALSLEKLKDHRWFVNYDYVA